MGRPLLAAGNALPLEFRHEIAGDGKRVGVVAREIFAKAGRGRVEICAAKLFIRRFLADGGFDERRPGQEDLRLLFDKDDIIRKPRQISAARRGRAVHNGNLGNACRRQPRLVREGPPAFDKHLALIEQVRAARLHEIDQRQLIFLRDLLRTQRFLQPHWRNCAALDGAVARQDKHALAGDDADAYDAAAAHDASPAIVVVHPEARKRGQFEKRRSMVKQARHTIARQELTAFRELVRLLRRVRDHGPLKAAEFLNLRPEMRGIRLEGFGLRRNARGDHRHGRRLLRGRSIDLMAGSSQAMTMKALCKPRFIRLRPSSGSRAFWPGESPGIPARPCMRPYP